ncbi:MAG TPA: 6,7-dimethyl-8-ribityllumazine synthase [Fimbriiglobus sp.]|jgi:6,7-dimethyl-8-ribityllumazine synthase
MPTVIEGDLTPPAGRFAVIAARFNSVVVDPLLAGALDAFRRYGVADERIDVIRVPGSFEIPVVAKTLGTGGRYAAVICLGCVVRGDTDHYDHVAGAAVSGIATVGLETGLPVVFGILTCDTLEQAIDRAGGKAGNKGYEAAVTAIEMANLVAKLKK